MEIIQERFDVDGSTEKSSFWHFKPNCADKKAIVSISNENFQLSAAAGILRHVCAQAFKLIMTKGSKF